MSKRVKTILVALFLLVDVGLSWWLIKPKTAMLTSKKVEKFVYQQEDYSREGAKIISIIEPKQKYRIKLDEGKEVNLILNDKTQIARAETTNEGREYQSLGPSGLDLFQVGSRIIVTYRQVDFNGSDLIAKEFVFLE